MRVGIVIGQNTSPPANYADLIKEEILSSMAGIGAGMDIVPQRFLLPALYNAVPGISYMDISLAVGETKPSSYPLHSIAVSVRERASISEDRIEVVLDG